MKSFLYLIAFIITFTACAQNNAANKAAGVNESIKAKAFQTTLKQTPNAIVLDVRTPDEVAQGAIPGAINIDFNSDDFKAKISALEKDKTYFVYCAKGGRSIQAVDQMRDLGFKFLYNLEAGFFGWEANGLPVKKQ